MVEEHTNGHDCCQLTLPDRLAVKLTRGRTRAHLRVEEEDLFRLRLGLGVKRVREGRREQQRLARLRVRLDQHAAQRHVADDAAQTVRERPAGAEDRDSDDGLRLAWQREDWS